MQDLSALVFRVSVNALTGLRLSSAPQATNCDAQGVLTAFYQKQYFLC